MKLRTVGPPERGSLSVVYSCPECGYEMAMLTNPYETQIVRSLGVQIGPRGSDETSSLRAESASASPAEASAEAAGTSGTGCPFTAMIPTPEGAREERAGGVEAGESIPVRWTAAAEARLANIPAFVRPMARTGIEAFARERGVLEVDEEVLDAAREFFGM
jgi:hypothetical protein